VMVRSSLAPRRNPVRRPTTCRKGRHVVIPKRRLILGRPLSYIQSIY
jgi:hypothetical protein